MNWGKDPKKRTPFGVWLDKREIYQIEIAKASGLSGALISVMCHDHSYKPSYMVYRKVRFGLGKLGYDIEDEGFW